ncbi:hypothetical protein [Photobacterium damselae]|uniref:hypothetical protein n=1 Tax=Photobacterium damselae TaxID=38293 RepID=UPI003B66B76A
MKKVKIVFNSQGSSKIGSIRIPMYGLRSEFEKFDEFQVSFNDYENYDKYDVAILHADEEQVSVAREKNKGIIIGLVKPHHERVVNIPFEKFSVKSFYYQFRFLFGDGKSKFIKTRNEKLNNSDFVISDTLYLHNLFESEGINSVYVRLIENYTYKVKPVVKPNKKEIVFGYHGNYRHFLESKDYIFPGLDELTKDFDVTLKVVSNLSEYKYEPNTNFKIEYYDYEFPGIYELLNDVDIGLVPNQIGYRNSFFEKLCTKFGSLIWRTDKYHDIIFRFKQSSNAGRAFIFAQLGKPFISCPTPEVASIFGDLLEEYMPFDKKTWKHCLVKLAKDEAARIRIGYQLLDKTSSSLNTKVEAEKLKAKILELVENK